jgi:hypothetical protein
VPLASTLAAARSAASVFRLAKLLQSSADADAPALAVGDPLAVVSVESSDEQPPARRASAATTAGAMVRAAERVMSGPPDGHGSDKG